MLTHVCGDSWRVYTLEVYPHNAVEPLVMATWSSLFVTRESRTPWSNVLRMCERAGQFEHFTSSFGRLRQKIVPKGLPHVQHDLFFSFKQSTHWFVALPLPSATSLSKHDVDASENVWKCNFAFLQSFFNYSKSLRLKCILAILELNWNQRLAHKRTKLKICHYMLTSSTQLQNRSFHVVERTRTSSKCQKMKNAGAKRAKILIFIVKYANLWGFCCRRRRGCLSSLIGEQYGYA